MFSTKDHKEITVDNTLEYSGYDSLGEVLKDTFNRGSVPSCCTCQSYVEPDGHCPHDNPSVLIKSGLV